MNDPLGDMLTRIRNAYGRKKPKVSTPASRLRARVLDVLKSEGYIRDYSQVDFEIKSRKSIELKYHEGQLVSARSPGVEARPSRLCFAVDPASAMASASRSFPRPRA
jgi:small subunit ribosomal protein S8